MRKQNEVCQGLARESSPATGVPTVTSEPEGCGGGRGECDGNEKTREGFLDVVSGVSMQDSWARPGRKVFRELALFVPCHTNWQPRSPFSWTLA